MAVITAILVSLLVLAVLAGLGVGIWYLVKKYKKCDSDETKSYHSKTPMSKIGGQSSTTMVPAAPGPIIKNTMTSKQKREADEAAAFKMWNPKPYDADTGFDTVGHDLNSSDKPILGNPSMVVDPRTVLPSRALESDAPEGAEGWDRYVPKCADDEERSRFQLLNRHEGFSVYVSDGSRRRMTNDPRGRPPVPVGGRVLFNQSPLTDFGRSGISNASIEVPPELDAGFIATE